MLAAITRPATPRRAARRAWFLVGLLWLAICLNFADRQVIFSIFPVLKSELGLSNTQLGMTGSLFLWVYAICSPVAGQIGDRFSRRNLVALSLLLWSGVTACTGLCSSAAGLLACRALIGVTEALFYPSAVALIAEAHEKETRSRAFAVFNCGFVLGVVLGGWYGGFMAQQNHWRWAFYSLGLAGMLYAAPLHLFLRAAKPVATLSAEAAERPQPGFWQAVITFSTTPTCLMVCAAYSGATILAYLLYTWLPTFLVDRFSLSLADAGFTATAYLKGGSIAGLAAGGWAADRLLRYTNASRLWVLAASLVLSAPCAYAISSAQSVLSFKLAAAAFGFCNGMYLPNLFASAFDVVAAEQRAAVAGLLNLVGAFVSGFASYLGGAWKDSVGLDRMIVYAAAGCVAAAAIVVTGIIIYFERDCRRLHRPAEAGSA